MSDSARKVFVGFRQRLVAAAQSFSEEELFEVPAGFRNNIAWNVGHLLVTHKLLCYGQSGLPLDLPSELVEGFRKGSSPGDWSSRPEMSSIVTQLVPAAESFGADYEAGRFETYEPYTTSAGITLESVDDALQFNNVHEGIHLGYIMALARALRR